MHQPPPIPQAPPTPQRPSFNSSLEDILMEAGKSAPSAHIECPIAPRELPPGYNLNGYIIERPLGFGGFGITYLATESQLNRQVVIKENFPPICYRKSQDLCLELNSPSEIDQFQWAHKNFLREARILATMEHPNIVTVLSFFEQLNTAYYVSHLIDGMSLEELRSARQLHERPFSPAEIGGLLVRILDALAYIHERFILHRDIKPDNILINKEGIPILIDFGAARETASNQSMTVLETFGYSPAEQAISKGKMGPWSDLYALGATLCHIITGNPPPPCTQRLLYDAFTPLSRRAELVERYSKTLLKSIDKALTPQLEQRYQSVDEWMNDLSGEIL